MSVHKHLGILRRREKRLSDAIKFAGLPESRLMTPGFATLIRVIVDQQVSVKAGAAIWAKLEKAAGDVTPRRLLKMDEPGLRACGFSGQKARYSLGLAEACAAKKLDLDALEKADDATVRETLTAFKGVGPWTADIYMMFGMGRPDVWPSGDLGLQIAIHELWNMKARPGPKHLDTLAEGWKPYRSAAALMLWHYVHALREKKKAG